MPARTRAGILVLVLALGLTGCDSQTQSSTGPSAAPEVVTVNPPVGLPGTTVHIGGRRFSRGATVMFGETPARSVSFIGSGFITATAPVKPAGSIVDVVVSNADGQSGKLAGAYTFQGVTLTVSPTQVTPGDQLNVSWVAPSGRPAKDWLGLFPLGEHDESYYGGLWLDGNWDYWWKYTAGASSGTMTLSAPEPGEYTIRYLVDNGFLDVARSAVVIVSAR